MHILLLFRQGKKPLYLYPNETRFQERQEKTSDCLRVPMYIYLCICVYIYIYIEIYIFIGIHIYIYIYIHIGACIHKLA